MAYLVAAANGNWTAAATWGAVDATSLLDSEAGTTFSTTSYVESSAFTPGAITIDGIAVKIAGRSTATTGTFSVRLAVAAVLVAGTEVTINVADLPVGQTIAAMGWWFFKFSAPVLLLAATNYTVSMRSSTASTVQLYRNGTAGNHSRMLRTTTTATPGAGDSMFVLGEWTGAGAMTARAVTMNETASTDYGGASTTLTSLGINLGGTLAYATAAATNYVLRLSGVLDVWHGGVLTVGTRTSPIPRDSTAVLEFDCGADGDFGIRSWGACTIRTGGLSRTAAKNVVQCLLNTDEAIAQTDLGVDTDTGWLSGDEIAIASTTLTATQAEAATLNGNATASNVAITAGLSAAHGGSAASLVQAEVLLLTRNVRLRSVSSSFMAYWLHDGTQASPLIAGATFDLDWTDFRYFGGATGANKHACPAMINTWPATFTATFCGWRDSEASGIEYASSVVAVNSVFSISDCTFYRVGTVSSRWCLNFTSNANASVTIAATRCGCIFDDNASSNTGFAQLGDATSAFTFDGCRVSSGIGRFVFVTPSGSMAADLVKRIVNCNVHCMGSSGVLGAIQFTPGSGLIGVVIDNCVIWRNAQSGSSVGAVAFSGTTHEIVISRCTFFGNSNAHIAIGGAGNYSAIVRTCTFSGDSTFATTRAWTTTQSNSAFRFRFENCTFGVATGIRVAHATDALNSESGGSAQPVNITEFTMVNCNIADATEFGTAFLAMCAGRSFIVKQRRDQVTATHEKIYPRLGTVAYETSTVRTVGRPSEKMTPTVGTTGAVRLRGSSKRIAVDSGKAVTVSCYVRKDGSYNGNQPRLILLANPALGIDDDLTLDTMTGAASQWEQLTGTMAPVAEEDGVVEVVVECDGSAGNAFVADWSASVA